MSLPQVFLTTGTVKWVDPTLNNDNSPIGPNEVTGYQAGLRSLTGAGSAAGTYPFTESAAASATSCTLANVQPALTPDNYALAVRAMTANGPGAWSAEFEFQGVLPLPLAPTGVAVS